MTEGLNFLFKNRTRFLFDPAPSRKESDERMGFTTICSVQRIHVIEHPRQAEHSTGRVIRDSERKKTSPNDIYFV